MHRLLLLAVSALFVVPVFAADPPPLPSPLPPQVVPPEPPPLYPREYHGPPLQLTREIIERLPLSPVVARDLMSSLGLAAPTATASDDVDMDGRVHGRPSRSRMLPESHIAADGPPYPACNDVNEDQETALVSDQIAALGNELREVTAYMKYAHPRSADLNNVRIHARTTNNGVTFTGGEMPLIDGRQRSGDPAMALNPYTSGYRPDHMYLVGSAWQFISSTNRPNSLHLWYTNNGGVTWGTPQIVARESDGNWFLDKPSIAVSWHASSLGWVYIVLARVCFCSLPTELHVYRATYDTQGMVIRRTEILNDNGQWSPQVVVDSTNGDVYVLWLNYLTNKIKIARSTAWAGAGSFGAPIEFDAGPFLAPNTTDRLCSGTTCVQARSVITARFNAVDRSIGVVWHARETNSTSTSVNTDVYINTFNVAAQTWRGKRRVNAVSTGDQFNGSFDYDTGGTYVVTFFDRRMDPNDIKYHMYAARLTAQGDRYEPNDVALTTIMSDPTRYTPVSTSGGVTAWNIGEYQDTYYRNGIWRTSQLLIPDPAGGGNGQGDIYLQQIRY